MPDLTNPPSPGPTPEGALDLERTLLIGLHLASQLSEIHRRGDVHGGVSPAVVDIDVDGRVTLLALTPDTPRDERYDAPEVVDGGEPTVQSDISGVGATLAAVALGRTPRRTASQAIDIYGHGLDAGLCNIIDAATAPDPLDRYESAGELISELRVVESRHGFIPTVTTTVAVVVAPSPRRRDRARIGQPNARTTTRTTARSRSRHSVLAISSAAALLIVGAGIGAGTGERSRSGRAAATPGVSADRVPSATSPAASATSVTTTSMQAPSTMSSCQSGSLSDEQGEVTVAEAGTLTTAKRETIPVAPPATSPTTSPTTLETGVPTVTAPPSSILARVGVPPSTAATPPTTPINTTPVTTAPAAPGPPTPSTAVDVPSTTAVPPTTQPVPTTQPAPTTQPVATTQPAPTTTVAPAKPPRVGQINVWKNPDDSGTWAFGAPEADRCAVARWELDGPVSTSKTKDPRDSSGATDGCFNDVQKFNTYFDNVALTRGDYTITLTVTHVTTGLSKSNSASFTVG